MYKLYLSEIAMGVNLYSNSTKVLPIETSVAGVPGVILQKEAVVLRAPLMKSELDHGAHIYHVASINDIHDYGFLPVPEKTIAVKSFLDKARKYTLKPWDIILTIVGTIGKVSIVPEYNGPPWIPSSNMFVVRFKNDKEDQAIAFSVFMRSRHGQEILDKLSHGKTISIVSKKQFSKIVIPYLSDEIRRASRKQFEAENSLFQERDELLEQVHALRRSYLNSDN
jgi:hypothetical protein